MNNGAPGTLVSLLDGVIDYAGLFPPAEHDMDEMVRRFAAGLAGHASWMLGRVVVPITRLDEFEQAAAGLLPASDTEDPWCLSLLVSSAEDVALAADIDRLAAFNSCHCVPENGLALADVIELRAQTSDGIDQALDLLPDDVFPFFELAADEDNRGLIAALAGSEAAAKIRTGGVKPELNPSTRSVARFIHQCVQAGVPFKATAGLHHPLPNEEPTIPAHQQGFLNVFAAAVVVDSHKIDEDQVVELLDLIEGFSFEDDHMKVGDYKLSREQIEEARAGLAISFGCCSWEDPLADLQALGLLPRTDSVGSS
ncbi:MAG: hypothetical protein VX527_11490 [Planctomycetota bacterium]|nr:hypothetical protein [Planctomycetota bacterium]